MSRFLFNAMKNAYLVTMYRYGNVDGHNYPLGIFTSQAKAELAGEIERSYRGRKYEFEVTKFRINKFYDDEQHPRETCFRSEGML